MSTKKLGSRLDQDEDDQKSKPSHGHFCTTEFLEGEEPNAFVASSIVVVPKTTSNHPRDILTTEEHFREGYRMLAGI
jgi:hypothetical protein